MIPIFTSTQIKEIDKLTISREPISSINLMQRAASELSNWIIENIASNIGLWFFIGPGNNGGDGLAMATILSKKGFNCHLCLCSVTFSEDAQKNLEHNIKQGITIYNLTKEKLPLPIQSDDVIIDCIFGSGLNKPVEGKYEEIINDINQYKNYTIAIDIPSGLFSEDNSLNTKNIIKADQCLTLEFPKLSMLLPDSNNYINDFEIINIQLNEKAKSETITNYFLITPMDISSILPKRSKYSHKGTYGHALLVGGSIGKMGAIILASKAAVKSGAGLVSSCIPEQYINVLNIASPECMSIHPDELDADLNKYSAIGIGPGLGTQNKSIDLVKKVLTQTLTRKIIDADALNLIAKHTELKELLNETCILTPHPLEFDRLIGKKHVNAYERLNSQLSFSKKHNCFIVLKGAHTSTSTPEGTIYFNSTGNPGMAKGGSGDVLTGILTSLAAQSMPLTDAVLLGVYLHGLSADIALDNESEESLTPSDIIQHLGNAFRLLKIN